MGSTQGVLTILRLCSGLLRLAQACSGLLRLCSGMLTLGSGILTLGSGILTLSSGYSSSCSRPQTKAEPAKRKINTESMGMLPAESSGFDRCFTARLS